MIQRIHLHEIHVRANHGCWPEEEIIGGDYVVDVSMDVDFRNAGANDDLSQTADYVQVKEIVYREMAVRSKLIETVGWRMVHAILDEITCVQSVQLKLAKWNAPMGGQVNSVSIEIQASRND
ncbi:MAG: dihydroneopterin aldolase [Flavobacteriales bacterium]